MALSRPCCRSAAACGLLPAAALPAAAAAAACYCCLRPPPACGAADADNRRFDSRRGSLATPALLAFSLDNGTKFVHTPSPAGAALSGDAAIAFARAALGGQLAPHIRSQPESPSEGPLIELVGANFRNVVHDPTKDVLVQFYSPSCGHCAKLRPVYEKVAAHFAYDAEVVVAQIDAIANEVLGLEPAGYPTIIFYPKANKRGVEYDGSRDLHDLVQFVDAARAGRNHIGGLPGGRLGEEQPDEDDGYRVEL